jgi:hypothetical protein
MATLTIPGQFAPRARQTLLSILSADADDLTGCHHAESAPAVEKCRETVGKINALVSALDTLGWVEGENGLGDAMLELEPPALSYIVAEMTGGDEQVAAVGDRGGQAWVAFLSDLQEEFAAVSG